MVWAGWLGVLISDALTQMFRPRISVGAFRSTNILVAEFWHPVESSSYYHLVFNDVPTESLAIIEEGIQVFRKPFHRLGVAQGHDNRAT